MRRYMIRIEVKEINEEGTVLDTYVTYQTSMAIADAEEANWIAYDLLTDAAKNFAARSDHSSVETVEAAA